MTETVEIAEDVARELIESCLDHGDRVPDRLRAHCCDRRRARCRGGRLMGCLAGFRYRQIVYRYGYWGSRSTNGAGKPRDMVEPGHPAANHFSESPW